jgi:hypothetical protein
MLSSSLLLRRCHRHHWSAARSVAGFGSGRRVLAEGRWCYLVVWRFGRHAERWCWSGKPLHVPMLWSPGAILEMWSMGFCGCFQHERISSYWLREEEKRRQWQVGVSCSSKPGWQLAQASSHSGDIYPTWSKSEKCF